MAGGTYVAPELFGDRLWNLDLHGGHPKARGFGVGLALVRHVEAMLRALGDQRARVMIDHRDGTRWPSAPPHGADSVGLAQRRIPSREKADAAM